MADDINKKITIQVEAQTDKLEENITSLNKAINELLANQQKLVDSGNSNSAAFEKNAAAIDKYQKQLVAATKKITSFSSSVKKTGTTLQKTQKLVDSLTKANDKLAKSVSSSSGKLRDLDKNTKTLATTAGKHSTKTAQSKKAIDGHNKSLAEGSKKTRQLKKDITEVNTSLQTHQGKVKTSKTAIDGHKKTIKALSTEFNKLKGVSGSFGPSLQDAAKGFNSLKSGFNIVQGGFKGIGEAIKADGFGFLLEILQKLFDYFVNTSKGSAMLKGAISAIGVVVNFVKGLVEKFKTGIIDAVTHPVESLKALGKMIIENVINRFKAFSLILDGIIHLDFKKMADGVIQATTGVTHATDKMAKAATAIGNTVKEVGNQMIKAYNDADTAGKKADGHTAKIKQHHAAQTAIHKEEMKQLKEKSDFIKESEEEMLASEKRRKMAGLSGSEQEQAESNEHYEQMIKKYKDYLEQYGKMTAEDKAKYIGDYKAANATIVKLTEEQEDEKNKITKKHNKEVSDRLLQEKQEIQDKLLEADKQAIDDNKDKPTAELAAQKKLILDKYTFEIVKAKDNAEEIKKITKERDDAIQKVEQEAAKKKEEADKAARKKRRDKILDETKKISDQAFSFVSKEIQAQSDAKVQALEKDKANELNNKNLTSAQKAAIEAKYKKKEGAIKAKAFKQQQEISIAQAVINGAIAITKTESDLGPIAGTIAVAAVIANTALQVATIAKQKPPAYAKGGLHYQSDGRGGVLSGYSRTDNTNAYLRSGEGIVVSEAMQVPWARNLVSAINVGFGGRDFSAPVSTRGFAVGGIFTDGGNANRYYNQPVNDQKNLANTVAYQMINNFPPVYVDVKDVNNQQNILAQTVNRVNL